MSLDASIISLAIKNDKYLAELQQAGVTTEMFEGDAQRVWNYVVRMKRDHSTTPSPDVLAKRFSWLELGPVRHKDMPILVSDLRKRHRHTLFIEAITEAVDAAGDPEDTAEVIQGLQSRLNALQSNGNASSLRDFFSRGVTDEVIEEIRKRRSGLNPGLPTGLTKFDSITGGMQRKRMIVVMGRTGTGKSFINLLAVATAVMSGGKFILYPLEMTLYETAFRLYTIFTQAIFGADQVLKNFDLSMGHITPRKVVRFLHALEDKFAGQLYVADVGNLSDPYTAERVEADCEIHRPDGFWVDYITLMKIPRDMRERDDVKIRYLSEGIKTVAQRQDVIGGCSAQVNREALKQNIVIPRPENISFGDALAHDADQIISINRKGKYLLYGLVKNRHGPEFGRTRVLFFPDIGVFKEDPESEDNEDDR